ncbi:AAA family ATPase, partial [Patescibacteria group bacterium]|nr:AAA family ATPase [Patescibacteria group bacterium]
MISLIQDKTLLPMSQKENLEKEIVKLKEKISSVSLPPELKDRCLEMVERLTRMIEFDSYSAEHERISYYIDWVVSLPWDKRSEDVLDLGQVKRVLDQNHYGLEEIKERMLEYISVLKLRKENQEDLNISRAPILCFVGLVGTGKTTIAHSIAESLNREFVRIPLGGMSSFADLRGLPKHSLAAEPGMIVKALKRAKVKNPVILLDELDRVAEVGRASIMGVLLELLDPEQNMAFRDHFVDYPLDLSEV